MKTLIDIIDLNIEIEKKKILRNFSLNINSGEIHTIMGPNGSGKSTLSNVIMGNPMFKVKSGKFLFDNQNITKTNPDERAKLGIFMAFQYPQEIEGVSLDSFLLTSYNAINRAKTENYISPSVFKFKKMIKEEMKELKIDESFLSRSLNKGFSGGEKKKVEILQMMLLKPKFVILDEIDSGLDIDALKVVTSAVNKLIRLGSTVLIITHYQRILHYIASDYIHVMHDGKIIKSGGANFADQLENEGYEKLIREDGR